MFETSWPIGKYIRYGGVEKNPSEIYSPATYESFEISLKPQDGRLHVFSMRIPNTSSITNDIGSVLEEMFTSIQKDGRQIVDFKVNSVIKENDDAPLIVTIVYK